MDRSKPKFVTVRVVSEGGGGAVVEVASEHETWLDAVEVAEKNFGRAVLFARPDFSIGQRAEYSLSQHPDLEPAVNAYRWLEQVKETFIVCAWDRKFDHPVHNKVVSYTVGLDDQGNPEPDRVAQPYRSRDHLPAPDLASNPAWVVIERFGTLEPVGRILAVFDTRKEAVAHAEQVREEHAREARREYDLSRESFGPDTRQVAHQYREQTLARDEGGSPSNRIEGPAELARDP